MLILPKGLHYYKFLKKERGDKVSKADFARLQRERLEAYFIKLIRAVVRNFRGLVGMILFKYSDVPTIRKPSVHLPRDKFHISIISTFQWGSAQSWISACRNVR